MKKTLSLFVLFVSFFFAKSQDNFCIDFCNKDLRLPITSFKTDDLQYCKVGNNTCDPNYPTGCSTVPFFDVQYSENSCKPDPVNLCLTNLCTLKMHVYYPDQNDYSNCRLPAILIFHGGAYNECGDYNDPGVVALGQDLATRGFVVFNVNYRVGVVVDSRTVSLNAGEENKLLAYVTAQQMLAIYRAMQDARGAIRSVIKMQQNGVFGTVAHPYQIDVNKIFLAGISAGSLISLGAGFFGEGAIGQSKIDAVFPGVSAAFAGSTPDLSSIDPTGVYYADRSDLSFDYHTKITGILNCWGALFIPNANLSQPYNFFSGQGFSLPPVISFCGFSDPVFWYTYQGVYFSPNTPDPLTGLICNTESRCLPGGSYTVPTDNDEDHPIKYETCIGSQTIYEMLKHPGTGISSITTEFYLDCQAHHGLDNNDGCILCSGSHFKKNPGCIDCAYTSNWGAKLAYNQSNTYQYIAGRAATFFQIILYGSPNSLNTSKFIECENYRHTCAPTDDNAGCHDDDPNCPTN
jgi:hypothetical protein